MTAIATSVLDPQRPVLPEWTRWAWASLHERDYWLPLFEKADATRVEIEWLTVIEGIRPAVYVSVNPDQLIQVNVRAASHGLTAIPVMQVNISNNKYSSALSGTTLDVSKQWAYLVLITHPKMLPLISGTPDIAINNEVLGEVLGYPKCCRDFFHRTWGTGQIDTTWDQYAETGDPDGPIEANMLWRWKNIRWVSHLPCSFQCAATIEMGRKTREAVKKHGLVEEAKIIDTVLSWPVRWSSVNGIAEIVGPAIKVSVNSDWAPPTDKRYFNRKGSYTKPAETIWTHNAFSHYAPMIQAHAPIIRELKDVIPANGSVIDLGCGNGRLLKTLKLHRPDVSIGGVDVNVDAIVSAQSGLVGKWHTSRLQEMAWKDWFAPERTVMLYSPPRISLEEMTEKEFQQTRDALSAYKTHIVYVYGDNLLIHTLQEWVRLTGFPVDKLTVVCDESSQQVSVGIIAL